jgi:uncharacterized membrane protein
MNKSRIEAFSDGVLAIILTIMVLELKVPHTPEFASLVPLIPVFLSYVLSFIYIGIYWSNHHHLFQAVKVVHGSTLWANSHLLFWLSLTPFVTAWSGENHFASGPVALYGIVLLMAAIAYYILTRVLLKHHSRDSSLVKAIGSDFKGRISIFIYAFGIGVAYIEPIISCLVYVAVAIMWIVPDPRIEKVVEK